MIIDDIKKFSVDRGVVLKQQEEIVKKAVRNIEEKYNFNLQEIKENFDQLLDECEKEAYRIYLEYEEDYGKRVFSEFTVELAQHEKCSNFQELGTSFGKHFKVMDKFFLSLAQSRKSRAGKTFESLHNNLFKTLSYPFTEQAVINGKPDFIMPSVEHYRHNPLECIIFTAKRTLRERWRQIVTEGTRSTGFYLATIDDKISDKQLTEMLNHKIFLVTPESLKVEKYTHADNVLSFRMFFEDHLDPKMKIWRRKKVI